MPRRADPILLIARLFLGAVDNDVRRPLVNRVEDLGGHNLHFVYCLQGGWLSMGKVGGAIRK